MREAMTNPYDAPPSTKVVPKESAARHLPVGVSSW
jgi:hypothetical protein